MLLVVVGVIIEEMVMIYRSIFTGLDEENHKNVNGHDRHRAVYSNRAPPIV
jgi:hypothetical protein